MYIDIFEDKKDDIYEFWKNIWWWTDGLVVEK